MNYAALKADLGGKAAGITDPQAAADAINGQPPVMIRTSRLVTKTTIYRAVGFAAGLQLIGTIKMLAASSDPAKALQFGEILDLLRVDGAGLDVSLDETRQVIDSLTVTSPPILSADLAAALKSLGEETVPYPLAIYGVPAITADHVLTAWRQP